jgi:hypothetical protein
MVNILLSDAKLHFKYSRLITKLYTVFSEKMSHI